MREVYERKLTLPVPAEDAFAWHERPGALDRLIPPWEQVAILKRSEGIRDGSEVELLQRLGPLKMKWVARHSDYSADRSFRDRQISGPFKYWDHLHDFSPNGAEECVLTDHIEYEPPGGMLGRLLGGGLVRKKLDAMLDYRHQTTQDDLATHGRYAGQKMKVAVTGGSGLVGSTLTPLLTTGGHTVVNLVRQSAQRGEVAWNTAADSFDATPLEGVDAVVHLAGENIAAARWSASVKDRILTSRVAPTRVLCEGLARMSRPPQVLAAASAIGFYGDRGDEILHEQSDAGAGFLADVARQWEAATEPARDAGIRVVHLRFGVVLSPKGGALAKMLLPFKMGAGGRVGSGQQFWSWISIDDAAGSIHHALMTDSLCGPVNAVAPNAVTNAEFTRVLARVLRRPAFLPMPSAAAKLALGEMANELLLSSCRVEPRRLLETGYKFRQPDLELALRHLLGKTSP